MYVLLDILLWYCIAHVTIDVRHVKSVFSTRLFSAGWGWGGGGGGGGVGGGWGGGVGGGGGAGHSFMVLYCTCYHRCPSWGLYTCIYICIHIYMYLHSSGYVYNCLLFVLSSRFKFYFWQTFSLYHSALSFWHIFTSLPMHYNNS